MLYDMVVTRFFFGIEICQNEGIFMRFFTKIEIFDQKRNFLPK